ncbi:MAG: hypothetical protein K1000chlam3_01357 [Chlamydiae bacterium]|nr:hypothetical protein [Chlamydiota bacterium]
MSAANPVAAGATTSTFENVKQGALNAVNWMGKQIQWLTSSIKEYAVKVFEWAKPFFQNIGKMLGETYDKVREFTITNKEASIAVGITAVVSIGLGIGAYLLCCNKEEAKDEPKKDDSKKIFA